MCRVEFPHLQKVLDKYKEQGFAVLAVNLEPDHDAFVLTLLEAMGTRFVPLKSNWEWAEKEYGVQGTPATALIDGRGRVMFKPVVHDEATRLVLEREVEALLRRP
jgi:hypothetical protein